MKIKEKINRFLDEKKLSHSEIGRRMGTSQQNISRFLGGDGRVPLDFVVWLANEYPEIDLEMLIRDRRASIVRDPNTDYLKIADKRGKALEEIGEILDKYMTL